MLTHMTFKSIGNGYQILQFANEIVADSSEDTPVVITSPFSPKYTFLIRTENSSGAPIEQFFSVQYRKNDDLVLHPWTASAPPTSFSSPHAGPLTLLRSYTALWG
jgi:hypothetical protein